MLPHVSEFHCILRLNNNRIYYISFFSLTVFGALGCFHLSVNEMLRAWVRKNVQVLLSIAGICLEVELLGIVVIQCLTFSL